MKSKSLNSSMIDDQEAQDAQIYADTFDVMGYADPNPMFITQRYRGYTQENQETWTTLYDRQMDYLEKYASDVYLEGASAINLVREHIPYLEGPQSINTYLYDLTGWQSKAVPGYLPAKAFFACLAERCFPTTIVIRPKEQIDYLPEPDIFHDVFGHVPLHADPIFAEFLQSYGRAALLTNDPVKLTELARLFWFTVEFGMIYKNGALKLYGSGLISSPGESKYALEHSDVDRRPFNLEEICRTEFKIDRYQPILYVLDSFEELRDAMNTYAATLMCSSAHQAQIG